MNRRAAWVILSVLLMASTPTFAEPERPGWVGLGFTYHRDADEKPGYLLVRRVLPGSPSALAGLQPQDLIVSINGKAPRYKDSLEAIRSFQSLRPGAELRFEVVRAGRRHRIKVVAAVMPDSYYELWKNNEKVASSKDQ